MPTLFFPKECLEGETRVSATPETVKRYIKKGFQVLVESGAGESSCFLDKDYQEAGAKVIEDVSQGYQEADVVAKVHAPQQNAELGEHEINLLKPGTLLLSFLWPLENQSLVEQLENAEVTSFAMDMIPRITRAQSMDALSSQSNIAGYRAAVLAAHSLPQVLPMMTTAAGTIKPVKAVILGAGVAGLQAIATAKRLGAVVEVSDVRPAVKEQVESLGGKFIEVESDENLEDEGGYAKEASEAFLKKQQDVLHQHMSNADMVISTALIPGRPAPKLIFERTVKAMKPGSVIVDLATERGGNCELSEPNQVVTKEGVTIIGYNNLPAQQPFDASAMYAKNIQAVIQHLYGKEASELQLDFEDEITQGSVITHQKKVVNQRVVEHYKLQTGDES